MTVEERISELWQEYFETPESYPIDWAEGLHLITTAYGLEVPEPV